jgi:cell division protein FtsI/penicillin-binding protein 2/cell division protein FtsW (lipid II flippase)
VGVTFTSAALRDVRRRAESVRLPGAQHLLLVATSIVAMMAIALSYGGRIYTSNQSQTSDSATNLNAVQVAEALEPALRVVIADAADRRAAASHLFEYVKSRRNESGDLPNVGSILGARVHAEARERPLLTSSDLAAVKPLLVVRTPERYGRLVLLWAAVYLASVWTVVLVWWMRRCPGDYLLLAAGHLLTAIGFAVILSRPDPLRDTALFVRYTQGVAAGFIAFAIVSLADFRKSALLTFSYVPLVAALFLCVMLLVFGSGPGGSNAKVNLGPVQPIEAIRLLLALFLAGYFARKWELLRQIRGRAIRDVRIPAWIDLPKLDYVIPVAVGVAAALTFFFLQKDLGPALVVSCIFLAVYAIARNRAGMALAGFAALVVGFYVGYKLNISTTLAARVEMWQSGWDNGARGGDQVAQAIWALSTGSLFGTGLGLGDTRYLPAGHTDLVLAAIGEELGFVGLLAVAFVFALIAMRGLEIALRAPNDYGFFLAIVVTLLVALPVLIMAAGMLGVLPLTGVVTPFLSYGGSAMVANFVALGILTSIRSTAGAVQSASPFRSAVTSLSSVLGVVALALIAVLVNVQLVSADSYVVKAHLGVQADGVRRHQYNQRILDIAAQVPRGTVYDRKGLPLATSVDDVARRTAGDYAKAGIELESPCKTPVTARCYPLGGATFHVLGDAATRRNWSALNSSYIERDADDHLRGFDEYGDLMPLLRHRYKRNHPDVASFLDRQRDITLTIDAPFQARVAKILARYAERSASRHAAAIVIDPATGEVLASVSYPFPGMTDHVRSASDDAAKEALLDRARYGLYPPGSTFKLVTAAAALRLDAVGGQTTFTCSKVSDSRVGARIPGWGLVRDDVLDRHAHGRIDLHDAIVQSCNAYFAQLAVRLGPRPILDTAALVGVSVAKDGSLGRLRATLPQAGYGQGDVVATPLRMARIAAAIAGDGVLREPRLDRRPSKGGQTERLLSPGAAAHLSQYLRDAVLSGTGRSLRAHAQRIAGKTGTAEIGGGPSHAWFVGFAPHGRTERKVAFAVILENAGYGGLAAAPAAGEIVSAAAASGLIQ